MLKLLSVALLVAGITLATNAQTTSQMMHEETVVRGAVATVERLDLTANTATIEVRNTSPKDIAAYVVSIDASYSNGHNEHSEKMLDYGPISVSRNAALHPGATSDQMAGWALEPGNPLQRVDVRVVAVVYTDKTAEIGDEDAFQIIVQHRTSFARTLQKTAEIVGNALADPAVEHAGSQAASEMRQLLSQKDSASSGTIDRTYARVLANELQDASQKASELQISEREYLTRRLEKLKRDAAANADYSQIGRTQ